MLTALHLGNFKAFAETQEVPIKPITLIFGANSSGKSSIIHALLLANHALANGNVDAHQPKLAGQSVDLGGFREFVHQHDLERQCALGFTFSHKPLGTAIWFGKFGRAELVFEIGIHTRSGKEHSAPVGVSSFTFLADDQNFLRAARASDGSLRVESINFDHPYFIPFFAHIDRIRPPDSKFRKTPSEFDPGLFVEMLREDFPDKDIPTQKIHEIHEKETAIFADFFGQLRLKLLKQMGKIPLRPGNLVPVSARAKGPREQYCEDAEINRVWRGLEELDNTEFFEEVAQNFCFEMEDLLEFINEEFTRNLQSLTYLGPLRCYPPRHLVGMHDQDPNWFSGGGHAWDILRSDQQVVEKVNAWLTSLQGQSGDYEVRVRHLKDLRRVGIAEKRRLAERLREVGANDESSALAAVDTLLAVLAADDTGTAFSEIALFDRRMGSEVSHRDVGVGISQILPVLVHALADGNKIVAIEQPEIHLHPALQAELGDVFIESALGDRKNTFLLETHSEHLILRIMRRIRETHTGKLPKHLPPVSPSDVSILYVEKDGTRSIVRAFPLNERGELVKAWPGGFFEEGLRELLD